MNTRTLFQIVVKIFGLFALYQLVVITAGAIATLFLLDADKYGSALPYSAVLGIPYLLMAVLFLGKSDWVCDRLGLSKDLTEGILGIPWDEQMVITAAVFVCGMWLILDVANAFLLGCFNYFTGSVLNSRSEEVAAVQGLAPAAIQIVIGLVVIANRNRIARIAANMHR